MDARRLDADGAKNREDHFRTGPMALCAVGSFESGSAPEATKGKEGSWCRWARFGLLVFGLGSCSGGGSRKSWAPRACSAVRGPVVLGLRLGSAVLRVEQGEDPVFVGESS